MNQKVKKEWLTALRSGEYQQCTRQLHNKKDGSYCCLGVLCELHRREFDNLWIQTNETDTTLYYLGNKNILPDEVVKWAGVRDGGLMSSSPVGQLIMANDSGKSFAEIADLIEENL